MAITQHNSSQLLNPLTSSDYLHAPPGLSLPGVKQPGRGVDNPPPPMLE